MNKSVAFSLNDIFKVYLFWSFILNNLSRYLSSKRFVYVTGFFAKKKTHFRVILFNSAQDKIEFFSLLMHFIYTNMFVFSPLYQLYVTLYRLSHNSECEINLLLFW